MPDLHQIPHLDEIAHHGEYHGVGKRVTETFADRYHHQNKVVPSLEDAIRLTGLRDGMTISFHHHFRNGDHIVNMVLDKLAEMGFHDLKLAASSLSAIHAPLIRHIQNGVITHIETSGMRGELAEAVSRGLMDCPVVFRSHGGRASAIRTGELHIDVAFLGAPSCDPYGNANGYSRDDDEGIACGSLGYARPDAAYADEVVIITNHLVAYPNAPWAIPEDEVDYVVVTDDIGDPKGIMSGATRYTKDPKELLIARNAANVIDAAGYLYDGFSMQMGSGGASLATARFLRQKMLDRGIHCRFALGGITGQITAMHEEGLIDRILDVQSFDLDAAKSLKNNHFHHQIGATYYASYLVDSAVDQLDFVVLSALEIDTDFNVNVLTGSDGVIRGAIGGHPDTAEGASLSVVVAPLTRGRIPTIVKHVNTVVTPGDAVDPILDIKPFVVRKAAIITTGNEVYHGRIQDAFTPVIEKKIAEFGAQMMFHEVFDDDDKKITEGCLRAIEAGAEIVFCTGGMSVDPDDKTPLAIKNTGARIVSYGSPVLPGAMFLLSYYDAGDRLVPICGLPGCAMYNKRTIFDIVLPRLMARDMIYAALPFESRVVNLREFPFDGGCLGCFGCAITGTCVYKDGFDTFLRDTIQSADAFVYAFTISDHYTHSSFKCFDDRQFCNGHRTVTHGTPIAYLISGDYRYESNLRMIIEGRSEVGGNYLCGVATDEGAA